MKTPIEVTIGDRGQTLTRKKVPMLLSGHLYNLACLSDG